MGKYKTIWEKVGNLLNIEFDIEPVYGLKILMRLELCIQKVIMYDW